MAVDKLIVLICTFGFFCCGHCQLNLSEGSPCSTNNINNGTCVRLYRCGSAVLTYLYRNAGFIDDKQLPGLPEICSYRNDGPVVCCTDCVFSEHDEFKESAIAPNGVLVSRHGPKAWKKCLDYFQRLPYPCHGKGEVELKRDWIEDNECHNVTLNVQVTVGGQDPKPWNFPHLALLGYGDTADAAQWLCEGTVISERFILTSAECTNAGVLGTVAYAALGLQSSVDYHEKWKIYNIKKIIIHPDYNEPSWYHDLALLETETQIRFDNEILPACLDVGFHDITIAEVAGVPSLNSDEIESKSNETEIETNDTKANDTTVNDTIANDTKANDTKANDTKANDTGMQTVFVDKLDRKICKGAYKPHNNLIHGYDHKTQMCYGVRKNGGDTCKRVNGSPLQIDQFRCQYTIIGVTGQSPDCGKPGVPDIYTRIQTYVPWIESIVWPDKD
ncbi:hypothetical protein PYW07_011201 [Mythimna separata]|uniref:Uncharacterized protein n=1 Tax=Mythimna separata TaxID=271217 RepID=A0AAD8DKZ0_MYTSE|nr:hypothetical protein PYW07_011201 [Mythimna separata]